MTSISAMACISISVNLNAECQCHVLSYVPSVACYPLPCSDLDVLGALMQRTDLKEVLREAEKKDRSALIKKTTSDLSERILVSPPPELHKPEH